MLVACRSTIKKKYIIAVVRTVVVVELIVWLNKKPRHSPLM